MLIVRDGLLISERKYSQNNTVGRSPSRPNRSFRASRIRFAHISSASRIVSRFRCLSTLVRSGSRKSPSVSLCRKPLHITSRYSRMRPLGNSRWRKVIDVFFFILRRVFIDFFVQQKYNKKTKRNQTKTNNLQNIHTTYIVNFVGFVCFSLFWFDMRNLCITFVYN